jgi:hypothetical protein
VNSDAKCNTYSAAIDGGSNLEDAGKLSKPGLSATVFGAKSKIIRCTSRLQVLHFASESGRFQKPLAFRGDR